MGLAVCGVGSAEGSGTTLSRDGRLGALVLYANEADLFLLQPESDQSAAAPHPPPPHLRHLGYMENQLRDVLFSARV